MNIILYKKLPNSDSADTNVIHYYSADGIITEQYPDGKTISWMRHPSDLWSKMPKDWVPGEVVHRLEGQRPLHFVPLPSQFGTGETIESVDVSKVVPQSRPYSKKHLHPVRGPQRNRSFGHCQSDDLFQQCLIRLP